MLEVCRRFRAGRAAAEVSAALAALEAAPAGSWGGAVSREGLLAELRRDVADLARAERDD